MSKVIKLKKGLDIKLVGEAARKVTELPVFDSYAVRPDDFKGITPKLLVKVDDQVKAGSPLFFDKYRPEVIFTSPVSGTVTCINRGEKRKILDIVVTPQIKQEYEQFDVPALATATREQIIGVLLGSGLWPMVIQRPYGIIADPLKRPKAVFVSGFDSAPLAPDFNFALANDLENLNAGFKALAKLTDGKVHLGLRAGTEGVLNKAEGVEKTYYSGPHPAGNVGVQIHQINPVNKGETVWTVDIQNVAIIGKLMLTGKVDMTKTIALAGSEIIDTQYFKTIVGSPINDIVRKINIMRQPDGGTVRIINGNVLTGKTTCFEGYLGYYNNMITVIPEGDHYEFLGWGMPRLGKFSVSKSYFSWIYSMVCPKHSYTLDTNTNGGVRSFVVTGLYDKYLPMDIYPLYLLKAILAEDIDGMENLGIYEVVEEDFALCEFVDPSKTDMQAIVGKGIELMIKELG